MREKASMKLALGSGFCSMLLLGGFLPCASAQTDPRQLESLGQIQDTQDSQRVAVQRAQQQAQAAALARQQAEEEAQERFERARELAREKRANALAAEKRAKQKDDRDYLHAKREIEIERQRAQLQMDIARAKHSEDYVKAELGQKQAETDSVAASNDATRNVATGTQHLLEASGQAEKMKQRHWWELKD